MIPLKFLPRFSGAFFSSLSILYLLASSWIMFQGLFRVSLGLDTGYYLPLAERIADGAVPFTDIFIGYTPFGIYHFALLALLTPGRPSIESYLLLVYALQIGAAFLVYAIGAIVTTDWRPRCAVASYSLYSMLFWEGYAIYLEPFVVFYGLLALFIGFKSRGNLSLVFLAGAFASCSFLSKQYGIASFVPSIIAVLLGEESLKGRIRCGAAFFLGALIMGVVIVGIPVVCLGSTWTAFFEQAFLHGWRGSRHATFYAAQFSLPRRIETCGQFFLRFSPVLFLLPVAHRYNKMDGTLLCIFVLATVVFAAPLSIATYPHYFILVVPFIGLLSLQVITSMNNSPKATIGSRTHLLRLVVCFFLAVPLLSLMVFDEMPYVRTPRDEQMAKASPLCNSVGPNVRVLLLAKPVFYYLCNFKPSHDLMPGFAFLQAWNPDELREAFFRAETIVIGSEPSGNYLHVQQIFGPTATQFREFLLSVGFHQTSQVTNEFEVWRK